MKTVSTSANRMIVKRAQARAPRWVMPAVKSVIILFDAMFAAIAFLLAFKFREGEAILSESAWAWSQKFVPYSGILFFAIFVRVAMLAYQRVYRYHGAYSYSQELIRIFKAAAVSSLLIVAWAFLFRGGFAFREFSYSRSVLGLDFVLAFLMLALFHLGIRVVQAQVRSRGINLIPTLIVGTTVEAEQTIHELSERRDLGYRVIGVVNGTVNLTGFWVESVAGTPVLGDMGDLSGLIRDLEIQEVIITDNSIASETLFESMMKIDRKQRVEFRFAPSLFNLLPQKTSVEQIGILPMVRLFRDPLNDIERFIKRASDLLIAVVLGIVTMPIWLIVSILIKSDSHGPIFYRQERVGMDGRKFLCYKFRTMMNNSDELIHRDMYRKNIDGRLDANAGNEDFPVFGKVKNDPRITRTGSWLRRTSLDELPQVLNVFLGEMSMVGPRPPIPYEVEAYEIWHRKRLDMKPGITGLWQVSGRNRLTFEEMVRVDLFYIENWSLLLDLKIILLTIPAVFRGDGTK